MSGYRSRAEASNIAPERVTVSIRNDEKYLKEFDLESKTLFSELLEKQRRELQLFDRNFKLDNLDAVDASTNFFNVHDMEEREELEAYTMEVKHKYNVGRKKLEKKQTQEQNQFWKDRNAQKRSLCNVRGISTARTLPASIHTYYNTPRMTPAGTQPQSPKVNYGDDVKIGFRSRPWTANSRSLPQSPKGERRAYSPPKSPAGFFLPVSRTANLPPEVIRGRFKKPKPAKKEKESNVLDLTALKRELALTGSKRNYSRPSVPPSRLDTDLYQSDQDYNDSEEADPEGEA